MKRSENEFMIIGQIITIACIITISLCMLFLPDPPCIVSPIDDKSPEICQTQKAIKDTTTEKMRCTFLASSPLCWKVSSYPLR